MKPPDGIEKLGPAEAWQTGYQHGRESLALSYQHDKEVREATDGRTLDRLNVLEAQYRRLQSEAGDQAIVVRDLMRRLESLEGRT